MGTEGHAVATIASSLDTPVCTPGPASDDEEDEEDEEDEGEGAAARDPYLLPITQEASLAGAERAVLSVDVEHTGSRVVTGSVDNNVRLYDFNGMKSDMKPFR
jgi:WD40 repeat protein